jgi:hypothetical protein
MPQATSRTKRWVEPSGDANSIGEGFLRAMMREGTLTPMLRWRRLLRLP